MRHGRHVLLHAVGKDAQSHCFHLGFGLGLRGPVSYDAGQSCDFSDPASVVFSFELNLEGHVMSIPNGWTSDTGRG